MSEEKKKNVKFVTSLALAAEVDDEVKHFQIVIVKEVESGQFRLMFDVVDPSKIKLSENEVPATDPA